MKHLESNDILTDVQYKFRSRPSCEVLTTNDLAKAIDNNTQVDMAILDFSKVFDKVAHNRWKQIFDFYGIWGNIIIWMAWIIPYQLYTANSGSLNLILLWFQGLLRAWFLASYCFCYITTNVQSQLHLFADDCLVYQLINSPVDHQILQSDLDTLITWTKRWQMEFNVSKCKTLQVSTHHTKSLFTYQVWHSLINCWAA